MSHRRHLTVSDEGDAITLRFADAPDDPLVLTSHSAQLLGMALQRADAGAARRESRPHDLRTAARCRADLAERLQRACELLIQCRKGKQT